MHRRLLIRPGAIGDGIVSLPALEALRTAYTEIWVPAQNVPLIRFADNVRAIPATGLDLLEIRWPDPELEPLIARLHTFQSIVSWYGTARREFRDLVGSLGLPFQFFPALPTDAGTHAVDFYLNQATTLANRPFDPVPRIPCPRQARASVVIHPFSGSDRKNWSLDQFRAVARALEPDLAVEWCAGPSEPLAEAHRFADLYELACWLAGAALYIGNDSGISHLAAAVGTPVIAVFGPTDPNVWGPRGEAVRIVRTEDSAESVVEVAHVLLADRD